MRVNVKLINRGKLFLTDGTDVHGFLRLEKKGGGLLLIEFSLWHFCFSQRAQMCTDAFVIMKRLQTILKKRLPAYSI